MKADYTCPRCGHSIIEHIKDQSGFDPHSGEYTVCSCCGSVGRFDCVLRVVELTPKELKELQKDDAVWSMLCVLRTLTLRFRKAEVTC